MTRNNRLIMFSLFFWGMGEGMWFFIRTLYLEQLGATPTEVGLALSIAALTIALSFVPGGMLADRFDRKRVLIAGWLSGVFAPVLMALANDWRQFMIGFTLYNASAFVVPAISTYVAHAAGGAPLERVFPVVFAGFSIGNILGPQVGQALLAVTDVRSVLALSSLLFGVSTLAVIFVDAQPVSRQAAPAARRVSLGDMLRSTLPFFAFLFVIDFGMTIGMQLIPNYLGRMSWRLADVSGIGSALPIGVVILSVLVGYISAGKRRRGLLAGQALVFAAVAAFAYGVPAWGGFAAIGFFMLGGYQTARQQAAAQVAGYAPSEHRGTALAIAETVGALALAVASLAGGVLFAGDPARPFHAAMLLIPLGIALTLRLRGLQQKTEHREAAEAAPVRASSAESTYEQVG